MEADWDPAKAITNLRKHGVAFQEAVTVFCDPLAYTFADPDASAGEPRWLTFGASRHGSLLVVCSTDRGDHIRIISARRATKHERKIYEES